MTENGPNDMTQNTLHLNPTNSTTRARKSLCLVIGLGDTPYAKAAEAHFTNRGWDVSVAKTAKDGRKLAVKQKAAVAVLAADVGPESGLLTCVKLTQALPNTRVVLVGKARSHEWERFAQFAGAVGFVAETDGISRLVRLVNGPDVGSIN